MLVKYPPFVKLSTTFIEQRGLRIKNHSPLRVCENAPLRRIRRIASLLVDDGRGSFFLYVQPGLTDITCDLMLAAPHAASAKEFCMGFRGGFMPYRAKTHLQALYAAVLFLQ